MSKQVLDIFTGTANPDLANEVANILGKKVSEADVGYFSDGEIKVQIKDNVRGHDTFILQSTCSPSNKNLMELMLLADALKRSSASRITAIVPYYGYARQDRRVRSARVPISAKVVADMFYTVGIDRVLTVDLHSETIQGFFDMPADNVYATKLMVDDIKATNPDNNIVVVSPDVGGLKMSDAYAQALDAPLAIVGKRRVSATEVEAINVIGEVEGRDVMLVDDMTETAGTLCAAAELLKENGAGKIYAGVSHGVLGDIGLKRLKDSCIEELITTDSTPMAKGEKVTTLSIASLLGEGIRRIENDESVTSLFDIVNK